MNRSNAAETTVELLSTPYPGMAAGDGFLIKLPASFQSLEATSRVGEFRILRLIGRGGMGVVYEAVQEPLGRRVALKVLPGESSIDAAARRRFLREAKTASQLQHDHIVPVYSVGEADGIQYIAMQLIDGLSLSVVLHAIRVRAGLEEHDLDSCELPLLAGLLNHLHADQPSGTDFHRQVARIIADAADALTNAHLNDIIHRDVKPGNLILDSNGRIWLTDFGLSKRINSQANTTAGLAGTLRYVSPEQIRDNTTAPDVRSDVYSLGLTLYELLALRPAYEAASDVELVQKIATHEPPRLHRLMPTVSKDLETIIGKATAREKSDRYQSASEFSQDLRRFLSGQPVMARPLNPWQRLQRRAHRHRRSLMIVGTTTILGIVLGLSLSTYFVWNAYQQAEAQRLQKEERERILLAVVKQVNRSEHMLKDIPGAQAEQRDLVRSVREALCVQADAPDASEEIRWQAALACTRLVEIESRFGNGADADSAAKDAHVRWSSLLQNTPDSVDYQYQLALSKRNLIGVYSRNGDRTAQIACCRESLELFRDLARRFPLQARHRNPQSFLHQVLAGLHTQDGDFETAVAESQAGLLIDQQLAKEYPTGHPQSYIRLVISHQHLADLLSQKGDFELSEQHFRKAIDFDDKLEREYPKPESVRLYTFPCRICYAVFLLNRNRLPEARCEAERCSADARRLAELYPQEHYYGSVGNSCRKVLDQLDIQERDALKNKAGASPK